MEGTPWRPERLVAAVPQQDLQRFRYVVLEELVDAVALLLVWSWPRVDARGRLFWPPEREQGPTELAVLRRQLWEQVYRGRLARDPRCGDAFGGEPEEDALTGSGLVPDLRRVFPQGLYDLSAEAHQAAKLAWQGGLAAVPPAEPGGRRDRVVLRGRSRRLELAAPAPSEDGAPR